MRSSTCLLSIVIACFALWLLPGCGSGKKACVPSLSASLVEEDKSVLLSLKNTAACEFSICTDNVYDAMACLDVRKYPDTSEFSTERVFGASPAAAKRPIITVSDYVSLLPGQEVRVPVNLRCIPDGCRLGDTVFISVYFKNIDPLLCSKVEVAKYDKATQDYCKRLHFIPNKSLVYWAGEVRTPCLAVHLCTYAPPRPKAHKAPKKEVVLRRSRSHPLKHKVF